MAKRLMVLATLLAAMLSLTAPAALAQEVAQQQYSPEGPPAAEEFAGSGVMESITGIDGGYGLKLPSGEGIYLEGDFDFESFVGQEVYVEGVINTATDGARIMTVERIEPTEVIPEDEEVAITGVVFEDEDFSDGTLYNVRDEGSGEVVPLVGGPGADFEPYLDQRATLYGAFVDENPNGQIGTFLYVLRAELAGEAADDQGETTADDQGETTADDQGETTAGGETTMGEETTATAEDGGTPEQAGIDLNEDGAVDEADADFAVQTSDEGVTTTPEEGALPGTGGIVLPVAGIVGALLLAGGLLYRQRKLVS